MIPTTHHEALRLQLVAIDKVEDIGLDGYAAQLRDAETIPQLLSAAVDTWQAIATSNTVARHCGGYRLPQKAGDAMEACRAVTEVTGRAVA